MKNIRIIFAVCIVAFFCGCSSDNNNQSNSSININQLENLAQSSSWIITNFNDSGNDETGHFSCYSFTFNPNGTITATNGTTTYNGTWSISNSNSNDDSSNDVDFNIHFNLTNEFEDLNDDWDIVSYTTNTISLIDVSGGNGGTDMLTFQIGTPQNNCTSQMQNTIQNYVHAGQWVISFFEDSGNNETNHFTGYKFTFNSNGDLQASNGTTTYNGTWSITDSNSNDDSINDLDFNIYFNLTNDFQDLNGDWDFISSAENKIELIDVSGGNGGTDYLTFLKEN